MGCDSSVFTWSFGEAPLGFGSPLSGRQADTSAVFLKGLAPTGGKETPLASGGLV